MKKIASSESQPPRCPTAGMKRDCANHYTTSIMPNWVFIVILKQLFIDCSLIDTYTSVFLGEMCSNHSKNHGYRQKTPEGTSLAMFDV